MVFPQIGLGKVHEPWRERFAEAPDVLKSDQRCRTVVPVLDIQFGEADFITMAGPCSVETELQLMTTANHLSQRGVRVLRGGAFKPRSSPHAFQGLGLEGLKILAHARDQFGMAIVTEVLSETDVSMVAEYADILQIGSRNMENFSLLEAAARSGRPILLKRGMAATVTDLLRSAQCLLTNGNPNVMQYAHRPVVSLQRTEQANGGDMDLWSICDTDQGLLRSMGQRRTRVRPEDGTMGQV